MSMNYLALALAMGGYGQKKKKKTKAKKSFNNWFEKLQVEELKSLCRATGLPVSGTKAQLCDRLCNGELTSDFAYEYAPERMSMARFEADFDGYNYGRPAQQGSKRSSGYNNKELKAMCREKGLIVSGKRYDLVLRILQGKTGKGGAPKRAAVDEDGKPKKRAKSMKVPNEAAIEKIEERLKKKFFPPRETKFKWSNNKHKYHPTDCIKFANDLLDKEVFEKELFERGEEKVAWQIINAILYRITVGNKETRDAYYAEQRGRGMIVMLGGTDMELGRCQWEISYDFLPRIVKAIKATSSKEVLEDLSGDTLWSFQQKKLERYNYGGSNEYDKVLGKDGGKDESFKTILNEYIPRKAEESDEEEPSQCVTYRTYGSKPGGNVSLLSERRGSACIDLQSVCESMQR